MTRTAFVATLALAAATISSAALGQDTGTATVRIGTRPFTEEGTVRFTGTPGGELVLGPGASLSAELRPGEHLSTLVTIGKDLADAGYELVDIQCDDQGSDQVSRGSADYRIATFRVESGESVSCVFWLESKRALAALEQQREEQERTTAEDAGEGGTGEEGIREEGTSDERTSDEQMGEKHVSEGRPPEASEPPQPVEPPQPATEERPPAEERAGREPPQSTTDCVCPKEGVWEVTNLEGWMDCSRPISFRKKLKGEDKNTGTIWILEEDCSRFFGEAHEKKREDVLMERVEGCGFAGRARAEEEGMRVILEGTMVFEGDEFLTGESHFYPEGGTMSCEGYRPFEMTWVEPIPADKEPKLRKEMERKLAEFIEKYYLPPESKGQ